MSKIDGWVTIEINTEGKLRLKDFESPDARLEQYMVDSVGLDYMHFEDAFEHVEGIRGLKDCLIMVFWNYQSVESRGFDYVDYEDVINYVSHVVIQENYKEFYKSQVSFELAEVGITMLDGELIFPWSVPDKIDEEYYNTIIERWETLYDEEFKIEVEQERIKIGKNLF